MLVRRPEPGVPIPLPGNFGESIEVLVDAALPNVTMPLVATPIVWSSSQFVFDTASFTFTPGTDFVTVLQAGRYRIAWSIGLQQDVSSISPSSNISQLELGGVLDANGIAIESTEDFFTPEGSMERNLIRQVAAGNNVRILARQFAGAGVNNMITGQMSLSIERML